MALKDLFGNMNIFGAGLPDYGGLLTEDQRKQIEQQALTRGLLGTAASYIAQPKTGGYGSALPYLGRAYLGGMEASQGAITQGLDTALKQKLLQEQKPELQRFDTGTAFQMRDAEGNIVYTVPKDIPEQKISTPKFDEETLTYMQRKYGTQDFNQLTADQQLDIGMFSNALSGKDAIDAKVKVKEASYKGVQGLTMPKTRNDYFAELSAPITTEIVPSQAPVDVKTTPQEVEIKQDVPLIQNPNIGGEQKQKLLVAQPQATASVEYAIDETRQMRNTVRRLLNNPDLEKAFGISGISASFIPGTPAADAKADLQTLKNQSFVQGLSAMRNASKSGGAVGNVSDSEGARFESLRASLLQSQSAEKIRAELERLDKELAVSEDNMSKAYSRTYGPQQFNVRTITPLSVEAQPLRAMPEGVKVRKIK